MFYVGDQDLKQVNVLPKTYFHLLDSSLLPSGSLLEWEAGDMIWH